MRTLLGLALFIPNIGVTVRRLHDLGHSGWFAFLFIIPLIDVGMRIYMAFPGNEGPNRFGPDPKQVGSPPPAPPIPPTIERSL